MRAFKDLGTVHRGDPCLEYPGKWILFIPARLQESMNCMDEQSKREFASQEEAISYGGSIIEWAEDSLLEYNISDFSVCWSCSDDDPRVGQVWFTPFYCAGRWNMFGHYCPT